MKNTQRAKYSQPEIDFCDMELSEIFSTSPFQTEGYEVSEDVYTDDDWN